MMQIIYQREFDGQWRRKGLKGTAGIYGLADPRNGVIRYVGSSGCIEHRLYSHVHSTGRNKETPKHEWVNSMRRDGVVPVAFLLQLGDFGPPQSEGRNQAESEWVAILQLTGGADLNVNLTPVGHPQSKDSPHKRVVAENRALKETNKKLLAENRALKETNKKLLAEIGTLKARIFTLEAEVGVSE